MTDPSTPLDTVSREVPDSELPPQRDEDAHRLATMEKVPERLDAIIPQLAMIERAMASMLPEVVAKAPLGSVVDVVSDTAKAYERLDEALSAVKKRLDFAKEVSVPERFDADKVKTFNTDRFRVTRLTRLFASIIGDEKEAAYKWLRDNGYDALIKETVNASSLSSAAKELIETGKELPDDLFSMASKNGVSITALKAKRGE